MVAVSSVTSRIFCNHGSQMSPNVRVMVGVVLVALVTSCAIAGCGSDEAEAPPAAEADAGTEASSATADGGLAASDSGADDKPDVARPNLPLDCVEDCTDKCGPARKCGTNELLECGGCPAAKVCDFELHTCETPKTKCADFKEYGPKGAECGIVTLSCGDRIRCGDQTKENGCPIGQECNPDTHECAPCSVTDDDVRTKMGFECGLVPNGCGQNVNLGSCEAGTCNPLNHRCERGPAFANIAAFRKAYPDAPSECGDVTNNKGGKISIGNCPSPQQCGIAGVANRCSTPQKYDPCEVAGVECGNVANPTACGGGTKFCGGCADKAPLTKCSDNGKCIDPNCTPATGPAGSPQCYPAAADGCGGKYPKKDCPTSTQVCLANKTCCTPQQVLTGTDPCTNGPVSNGCGNVDRACVGANKVCLKKNGSSWSPLPARQAGNCCVKKTCAVDYAGSCSNGLDDGCGGTLDCGIDNCPGGAGRNECINGSCCARPAAPDCNGRCTGDVTATSACGATRTRTCGTNTCTGGTNGNTCDVNGNCCPLPDVPSCGNKCEGTETSTNGCGTRETTCSTDNCPGGAGANACVGGTCCALPDAPSCGNQCSGTVDATNACGTRTTNCGPSQCTGGQICGAGSPQQCCTPVGAPSCGGDANGIGKQCNVTLSAANSCNTETTNCSCGAGLKCSSSTSGVAGTCRKTCGGSDATGYAGKCGTGLSDGAGGTITCASCGAGKKCATAPAQQKPGTVYNCVCDPDPASLVCPPNYTGPLSDSCGTYVKQCTG
jgi:hypothetical protein